MEIKVELTKNPKAKPQDESKLGFGQIFTDHMFLMNYDEGQGWHDARIVPYGPIELEPAIFCRLGTPECGQSRQANDGLQACVQVFHTNLSFKVNCCVV